MKRQLSIGIALLLAGSLAAALALAVIWGGLRGVAASARFAHVRTCLHEIESPAISEPKLCYQSREVEWIPTQWFSVIETQSGVTDLGPFGLPTAAVSVGSVQFWIMLVVGCTGPPALVVAFWRRRRIAASDLGVVLVRVWVAAAGTLGVGVSLLAYSSIPRDPDSAFENGGWSDPPAPELRVGLAVLIAGLALGVAILTERQRWRERCRCGNLCAACGYPRSGDPREPVCPECGKHVPLNRPPLQRAGWRRWWGVAVVTLLLLTGAAVAWSSKAARRWLLCEPPPDLPRSAELHFGLGQAILVEYEDSTSVFIVDAVEGDVIHVRRSVFPWPVSGSVPADLSGAFWLPVEPWVTRDGGWTLPAWDGRVVSIGVVPADRFAPPPTPVVPTSSRIGTSHHLRIVATDIRSLQRRAAPTPKVVSPASSPP